MTATSIIFCTMIYLSSMFLVTFYVDGNKRYRSRFTKDLAIVFAPFVFTWLVCRLLKNVVIDQWRYQTKEWANAYKREFRQ